MEPREDQNMFFMSFRKKENNILSHISHGWTIFNRD